MTDEIDGTWKEQLAQLERSVEAPVVPGELERWLRGTVEAFQAVRAAFREQIDGVHKEYLESISTEDSGLLSRVEKMEKQDEQIGKELDSLASESEALLKSHESRQADETALADVVGEFAERTIALVIRIRKQDAALETWYQEALERDRGIAD